MNTQLAAAVLLGVAIGIAIAILWTAVIEGLL